MSEYCEGVSHLRWEYNMPFDLPTDAATMCRLLPNYTSQVLPDFHPRSSENSSLDTATSRITIGSIPRSCGFLSHVAQTW